MLVQDKVVSPSILSNALQIRINPRILIQVFIRELGVLNSSVNESMSISLSMKVAKRTKQHQL